MKYYVRSESLDTEPRLEQLYILTNTGALLRLDEPVNKPYHWTGNLSSLAAVLFGLRCLSTFNGRS